MTSRPVNCPGVNQNGWKGGVFSWNSAWILHQMNNRSFLRLSVENKRVPFQFRNYPEYLYRSLLACERV